VVQKKMPKAKELGMKNSRNHIENLPLHSIISLQKIKKGASK